MRQAFASFLIVAASVRTINWFMPQFRRNVYNGEPIVHRKHFSVEHVVPKRLFPERKDANRWLNQVPCDRYTNAVRSDLRLGDPGLHHQIFIEYENASLMPQTLVTIRPGLFLVVDGTGKLSGIINRYHRVFTPSLSADMGLLCRSIRTMLSLYPHLYGSLDQIIQDPGLLDRYHDTNATSDLETTREHLFLTNHHP